MDRMQARLLLMAAGIAIITLALMRFGNALWVVFYLDAEESFYRMRNAIGIGCDILLGIIQLSLGYWLLVANGPRMQWLVRRIVP